MANVVTKIISYILIIVLGYALKRAKLFRVDHADVIAKIILNITLPCVLVSTLRTINFSGQFLVVFVFGLVYSIIMLGIGGFFSNFGKDKGEKTLYGIFIPSQNIGIFGIPIAQACFSTTVIASLCIFDIGNAAIMFGPSFILASVRMDGERPTVGYVFKKLFSSPAFDVYILLLVLSFFNITLPAPVFSFAEICGAGNGFLAMLLFGIMFEANLKKSDIVFISKIIGTRLAVASVFSVLVWLLLPIPQDLRIGIVVSLAMPTATASAVHAASLGCNKTLVSGIASISLVISGALTLLLAAFLS